MRERQRLQAMGRSSLAMHGIHVTGKWWKGKTWKMIRSEAPGWVVEQGIAFQPTAPSTPIG